MSKKLNSRRGETLAETLAAILVIALAALLMSAMVNASVGLVSRAKVNDAALMTELNTAEIGSGTTPAEVTVTVGGTTPYSIAVTVTGGAGQLRSYEVTP